MHLCRASPHGVAAVPSPGPYGRAREASGVGEAAEGPGALPRGQAAGPGRPSRGRDVPAPAVRSSLPAARPGHRRWLLEGSGFPSGPAVRGVGAPWWQERARNRSSAVRETQGRVSRGLFNVCLLCIGIFLCFM